jgi:hypothetical protein
MPNDPSTGLTEDLRPNQFATGDDPVQKQATASRRGGGPRCHEGVIAIHRAGGVARIRRSPSGHVHFSAMARICALRLARAGARRAVVIGE